MSCLQLRSAPTNWLLGTPISSFSTARLPRGIDALRMVQYYHLEEGKTLSSAYILSSQAIDDIWQRARIPTQCRSSCVRKLSKLYEKYLALKKNRLRQRENDIKLRDIFQKNVEKLFDIATADALTEIKNCEDRTFLQKQREDVFSCSMSVVDLVALNKENRKRQREEVERITKEKYNQRKQDNLTQENLNISSSSSSQLCESDEEFKAPVIKTAKSVISKPPKTKIFEYPGVVAPLDRAKISDRSALFVVGNVAKAFGHDISKTTTSRSSIRRSRIEERKNAAIIDQKETSLVGPFLLHWDGKLLPDISGSKEKVDRMAILITGNGQEKLLGIPKISKGTGENQAMVCIEALEKWNIKSQVKGLVFDTRATNTGLNKGACTIIEKKLNTELVWIACRHHIMEIMFSAIFLQEIGSTQGPETAIFKCLQKMWPNLDHTTYNAGDDKLFSNPILKKLKNEMLEYLPNAMNNQQPRDDYRELLQLSILFLGGETDKMTFRAPGASHHARWLAKEIYCLKICLFRKQLTLEPENEAKMINMALFISLVYVKFWNESPLAIQAPYNDILLLRLLKIYPNRTIGETAYTAFSRHMWYLSEHLVALSFFDDRIPAEIKKKMVTNLCRPPLPNCPRRILLSEEQDLLLEVYVTERTNHFFNLLVDEGKNKAQEFLNIDPELWLDNCIYKIFNECCRNMRVVNDTAERGIGLIKNYNQTLTKDEDQMQYILQLVANHRKQFPQSSKAALLK